VPDLLSASHVPDDDTLAAFADRFLLRAFLDPVQDPRLEELFLRRAGR
jgi:MoxR-like ATPase